MRKKILIGAVPVTYCIADKKDSWMSLDGCLKECTVPDHWKIVGINSYFTEEILPDDRLIYLIGDWRYPYLTESIHHSFVLCFSIPKDEVLNDDNFIQL